MNANGSARRLEESVQRLLDGTHLGKKFGLRVYPAATRTEDSWVYIVVVPNEPGIRATDFVDVLGQVEAQVRKDAGSREILLVPASH